MCESRIHIIFLSFHLLNQEAEVMSSNGFPWDFINFLDCIFCALSKQYSMVFRDEVKAFFKRGEDGKQNAQIPNSSHLPQGREWNGIAGLNYTWNI